MKPVIPSSGKLGSRSLQLSTSEPGPNKEITWSVVRQSMARSGLTTTVRASVATSSSVKSTPASSHTAASSSLIGREASEMSVSPPQNFSKPPPVPEKPTETWMSGKSSRISSAAVLLMG